MWRTNQGPHFTTVIWSIAAGCTRQWAHRSIRLRVNHTHPVAYGMVWSAIPEHDTLTLQLQVARCKRSSFLCSWARRPPPRRRSCCRPPPRRRAAPPSPPRGRLPLLLRPEEPRCLCCTSSRVPTQKCPSRPTSWPACSPPTPPRLTPPRHPMGTMATAPPRSGRCCGRGPLPASPPVRSWPAG